MTDEEIFELVFNAAPADRGVLLDRHCAHKPELRQRIEKLLGALESDPPDPALAPTQFEERPESLIAGRYRLVEKLGSGGMGEVWVAKQSEPVKRKVALKLIKKGMDSPSVLARFEQERQALALMDHPNIARVLDGGLTESGKPFFVMELVAGRPFIQFCDEAKLGIRERLELFIPICQAVQHAHQKGIVHRDLKPANILVTLVDGKPMPKVIDFGVAKALSGKLTADTLSTQFGAAVGTLEYMAPEQTGLSIADVDTRADVYSLGIVLYELLTGLRPFDARRLRSAAVDEIKRIILEEDPPSLASRLSTDESLPSAAAVRGLEPKRLLSMVKGELDWIVLRCLEKDRNRRYESVSGLGRDVERFLNDEPVEARPVSAGYRFKKFLRRNKGPVLALSALFLSLTAGVVSTTMQMLRADAAVILERQAKEDAQRNLAFAKKGNEILGSVFAGLEPKRIAESGRPLQDVLRENLGQAVRELEGAALGDPLEVAEMQNTLGRSLLALGDSGQATEVFRKALDTRRSLLGPDHPRTLVSMNNLAAAYREGGHLARAQPLLEKALATQTATLGPDHADTLASMNNLAGAYREGGHFAKALQLLEEAVAKATTKSGPDHPDTLTIKNSLALAYQDGGQLDRALRLFEAQLATQTAKLGPDHPNTLSGMNNLALAYRKGGQLAKALPLFESAMAKRNAKLGPDHPDTLNTMHSLAMTLRESGQIAKALSLLEETLSRQTTKLGTDHPHTLMTMNNLGAAYAGGGQVARAIPLLEEVLALKTTKLGRDHPETLTAMHNLATTYYDGGQLDRSVPLFEEALAKRIVKFGPDQPATLLTMEGLANAYRDLRLHDRAIPLFEEVLAKRESKLGRDHLDTLTAMHNLGTGYYDIGRLDRAVPLLEDAVAKRKIKLGTDHPHTIRSMNNLFNAYFKAKNLNQAKSLLAEIRQVVPKHSPQLASMLVLICGDLLEHKKWPEAEPLLRECFAIRERAQPDAWTTFNTQSLLGEALLGQKKYAEAEPLLLKGYEGMKAREKTIPKSGGGELRIPQALDRLLALYTAQNKPEDVKKWQDERKKYPSLPLAKKK